MQNAADIYGGLSELITKVHTIRQQASIRCKVAVGVNCWNAMLIRECDNGTAINGCNWARHNDHPDAGILLKCFNSSNDSIAIRNVGKFYIHSERGSNRFGGGQEYRCLGCV